jgi:ribosomal protein L31E
MLEKFRIFEKSIKKEHRFWSPKYKAVFKTSLTPNEFIVIAEKTVNDLDWFVVFKDETTLEAKVKRSTLGTQNISEGIIVKIKDDEITVLSKTLGNEMWDNGRNSICAKLFVYAFQETENSFTPESLAEQVTLTNKADNWDHYEIPESLPIPQPSVRPKFYIPVFGGMLIAFLMAVIIAKLSLLGHYYIVIFEVITAVVLAVSLKYLIELSNYTNFTNLNRLLIAMVACIYFFNQYLQYQLFVWDYATPPYNFLGFLASRIQNGLLIKSWNTGWIGFLVLWVFQFVITFFLGITILISNLSKFQFQRVPKEVVDFAFFHFLNNKSVGEIREELASKGWSDPQKQDEVFEALLALQTMNEMNRPS